ncbi:hypothetical protein Tco_0672758 [Tanacetum coccineum]
MSSSSMSLPYLYDGRFSTSLIYGYDVTPLLTVGYVRGLLIDEGSRDGHKEDHADYPDDGGDGGGALAPTDSSAIPVVDLVPSAGDTEAFETDEVAPTHVPSPRRNTVRMSVRPHTTIPIASEASREDFCLTYFPHHLHYDLASLSIPPPVDHREDTHEAELPPRKRLCLITPTLRNKVRESSTAAPRPTRGHRADYGFIGTMDVKIRRAGHSGYLCGDRGWSGQTDSAIIES